MAKHPVPKRKKSVSRMKKRYGSFKTKTLKKLSGLTHLVPCQNCGKKCLSHTVCPNCGMYHGKQIIDKKKQIDKITKIKA